METAVLLDGCHADVAELGPAFEDSDHQITLQTNPQWTSRFVASVSGPFFPFYVSLVKEDSPRGSSGYLFLARSSAERDNWLRLINDPFSRVTLSHAQSSVVAIGRKPPLRLVDGGRRADAACWDVT